MAKLFPISLMIKHDFYVQTFLKLQRFGAVNTQEMGSMNTRSSDNHY